MKQNSIKLGLPVAFLAVLFSAIGCGWNSSKTTILSVSFSEGAGNPQISVPFQGFEDGSHEAIPYARSYYVVDGDIISTQSITVSSRKGENTYINNIATFGPVEALQLVEPERIESRSLLSKNDACTSYKLAPSSADESLMVLLKCKDGFMVVRTFHSGATLDPLDPLSFSSATQSFEVEFPESPDVELGPKFGEYDSLSIGASEIPLLPDRRGNLVVVEDFDNEGFYSSGNSDRGVFLMSAPVNALSKCSPLAYTGEHEASENNIIYTAYQPVCPSLGLQIGPSGRNTLVFRGQSNLPKPEDAKAAAARHLRELLDKAGVTAE